MDLRRKTGLLIISLVLLAALALSACGKKGPLLPAIPTPETNGNMEIVNPTDTQSGGAGSKERLAAIEKRIEEGEYYLAFREMLLFEEDFADSPEEVEACQALFERLRPILQKQEPASGEELARTFRYYGGCELVAVAESGPLLLTVSDTGAPQGTDALPPYVRFYVRKGERGTVHLPAGTYHISYQVGYLWFDGDIGFGDYWNGGELEEDLTFSVSTSDSYVSNSRYTLTF